MIKIHGDKGGNKKGGIGVLQRESPACSELGNESNLFGEDGLLETPATVQGSRSWQGMGRGLGRGQCAEYRWG